MTWTHSKRFDQLKTIQLKIPKPSFASFASFEYVQSYVLYCEFIRPSTFNIIINYNANISNGHMFLVHYLWWLGYVVRIEALSYVLVVLMAVKYWETKFSLECTEDWTCLMTRLGSSGRSVQSRKTRPQAGTSVIKPHFKAHKSRSCSQFNKVKSACNFKTKMFHLTDHDYWESFQSLMKYKAMYYFK